MQRTFQQPPCCQSPCEFFVTFRHVRSLPLLNFWRPKGFTLQQFEEIDLTGKAIKLEVWTRISLCVIVNPVQLKQNFAQPIHPISPIFHPCTLYIYDGSRTPSNELWLHGYGFPMVSLSKIPFVHWIAQSLTRWPSSPVLPPASAGRWLDSGRPRVWADTDILERIKVSAENTWTW